MMSYLRKKKKKKETSQINYDSPSRFTERREVENEGRSRGESIREERGEWIARMKDRYKIEKKGGFSKFWGFCFPLH